MSLSEKIVQIKKQSIYFIQEFQYLMQQDLP